MINSSFKNFTSIAQIGVTDDSSSNSIVLSIGLFNDHSFPFDRYFLHVVNGSRKIHLCCFSMFNVISSLVWSRRDCSVSNYVPESLLGDLLAFSLFSAISLLSSFCFSKFIIILFSSAFFLYCTLISSFSFEICLNFNACCFN